MKIYENKQKILTIPGSLREASLMRHLLRTLTQIAPNDMEFIYALPRPTVAIPKLQDKLEDNKITDELTHEFVSQWLEAFRDSIEQLNK